RAGFSDEEGEAGQASSLRGLKSLEVWIPVSGIGSLEKFTFDISSSGTGPKDFLLSYSVDGGANYHVLKEGNQFEKMSDQARNHFELDISSYEHFLNADVIKFKFEMLAGERPVNSDDEEVGYNETAGVVRMDNIRLSGVYNGEPEEEVDRSMPS